MNFSPRLLKIARYSAGLDQKELAHRAGCHKNTIGHYERGEFGPSPRMYAALCRVLGVSTLMDDASTIEGADSGQRGAA